MTPIAQKRLRELKSRISAQSKKNFVLERDVRYLDSRIALLIQNRMALDEVFPQAVASGVSLIESVFESKTKSNGPSKKWTPTRGKISTTGSLRLVQAVQSLHLRSAEHHQQQYANLFFLLQSEPRHIASLCRLVSLSEIDTLLQTVMFTLYGNQYESREEHLLLTMFQVSNLGLSLRPSLPKTLYLQSVLSAQFETATEFGSLLRANTPVSRMMTTYTRRGPGQSYLKSVLAERINSLIEHKDLNLEINPVKVRWRAEARDLRVSSCRVH